MEELGTSLRLPPWLEGVRDRIERVLSGLGAAVEKRIYPGMPHTVVRDELDWVAETMGRLAGSGGE